MQLYWPNGISVLYPTRSIQWLSGPSVYKCGKLKLHTHQKMFWKSITFKLLDVYEPSFASCAVCWHSLQQNLLIKEWPLNWSTTWPMLWMPLGVHSLLRQICTVHSTMLKKKWTWWHSFSYDCLWRKECLVYDSDDKRECMWVSSVKFFFYGRN